jgi:hypothetical protein
MDQEVERWVFGTRSRSRSGFRVQVEERQVVFVLAVIDASDHRLACPVHHVSVEYPGMQV